MFDREKAMGLFTCVPVGDQAISIQFAQVISPQVNEQVFKMAQWIRENRINGVTELVPTYASLLIYYQPQMIRYQELVELLNSYDHEGDVVLGRRRIITIPALYGGECGPDLEDVSKIHSISIKEVVELHTSVDYHVYMLGFSPGFPYLGGLPLELYTPRLATPRSSIRAGSIGIAGAQTGIYSLETPGGWRIIAHTPIPLFNLSNEDEPFLLRAGDSVRFRSVSNEEYQEIEKQIQNDTYRPNIKMVEGA